MKKIFFSIILFNFLFIAIAFSSSDLEKNKFLKVLSSDKNQIEIEYNNPTNETSFDYLIFAFPTPEYKIEILAYKSFLEKSGEEKRYFEYSAVDNNESNSRINATAPLDDKTINSIIVLKGQGILRRLHIYKLNITPRYNEPVEEKQYKTLTYLKFKILFDNDKSLINVTATKESVYFKKILEKCVDNKLVFEKFQDYSNTELKDIEIFPQVLGSEYAEKTFVKLTINKTGLYLISERDLIQAGIDTSKIDIKTLQLFNQNREVSISVETQVDDCRINATATDEKFRITFLGRNLAESTVNALNEDDRRINATTTRDSQYSDDNVYWLVWNVKEGQRIVTSSETNNIVSNCIPTVEKKILKFALEKKYNYENGFFYWDEIDKNGRKIVVNIPEIMKGENSYKLRFKFNRKDEYIYNKLNNLLVLINGGIEPIKFTSNKVDKSIFEFEVSAKILNKGANFFNLFIPLESKEIEQKIFLEFLEIEGDFEFTAKDDSIKFVYKNDPNQDIIVSGFNYSPIICYDVDTNEISNFSDNSEKERVKKWYEDIKLEIFVASKGGPYYLNQQLFINGKDILGKYFKSPLRGYCLYVIDKVTGEIKDFDDFDTYGDEKAFERLVEFVDKISPENIVIGLVMDEGSNLLTESAVNALKTLGVKEDIRGKTASAHIFIGQKGLKVGKALECFSQEGYCILTFPLIGDKGITLDKRRKNCFIASNKVTLNPLSIEVIDFPGRDTTLCISAKTQTDYLIITHRKFMKGAERLAEVRRNIGLSAKVIDIDTIYNCFNNGIHSPYPLRDFLRYAYINWEQPSITFVCLVGDSNWDMKDKLHTGVYSYLPSYTSSMMKQENANDDWFAKVESETDFPDMIVGRIPVEEDEDLENYIDKIEEYERADNFGIWKERTLVITDNTFETNGRELNDFIPENFVRRQVSISDYPTEDNPRLLAANIKRKKCEEAKEDIIKKISEGNLVVQYVGHGGGTVWAHEDIFFATGEKKRSDAEKLTNKGRYSFISNMSCLTGIFNFNIRPFNVTLSEAFLLKKDAGAIGLYSPSGKDSPSEHLKVSNYIYNGFFKEKLMYTGAAVYYGETKYRIREQGRSLPDEFNLIGDPAVILNIPTYQEEITIIPKSVDYRKTTKITVEANLKNLRNNCRDAMHCVSTSITSVGNGFKPFPTKTCDINVAPQNLKATLYFLNDKKDVFFKLDNLDISDGELKKDIEIPANLYTASMQVNLYYYDKEKKIDGVGNSSIIFNLPVFSFSDNYSVVENQNIRTDVNRMSPNSGKDENLSDKITINILNNNCYDLKGIPLLYKLNDKDWQKVDTEQLGWSDIESVVIQDKLNEGLNELVVKADESYTNLLMKKYEIIKNNLGGDEGQTIPVSPTNLNIKRGHVTSPILKLDRNIEIVRVYKDKEIWFEDIKLKLYNLSNADITNFNVLCSKNSDIDANRLPTNPTNSDIRRGYVTSPTPNYSIKKGDFVFINATVPFENGEKEAMLFIDVVQCHSEQSEESRSSVTNLGTDTSNSSPDLENLIMSASLKIPLEMFDLRIVPNSLKVTNSGTDVNHLSPNLIEGHTIFFEFEVENLSSIPVNNVVLSVSYKGVNGVENVIFSEYLVDRYNNISLKPKEKKKIKCRWDPFDNKGQQTITVKINPNKQMQEVDESNNTDSINIYVKAKADLEILKSDLTLLEGKINSIKGERTFSLILRNKGEVSAENIGFNVSQLDQTLYEENINKLEPGEKKEIKFKINVIPGIKLYIKVNEENTIDESDFSNNQISINLEELMKKD